MLKASELRIGNYIKTTGDVIVKAYDAESLYYIQCYGIQTHKPIPLTEEVLLKCGFEKCIGKYGTYFKHKYASLMRIWQHDSYDKYIWVVGKKLEELQKTIIVSEICNHLHQLQNLYFSLTGQELEIEL